MNKGPVYPTEYKNYDDLIEATYGNFDKIPIAKLLFDKTIISKRFCTLFPSTASRKIQKILVTMEERLSTTLGQSFLDTILPFTLHQELYNAKTPDEVRTVTDTIKLALDKGEWDQHPDPPQYKDTTITTDNFDRDYNRILMPFLNIPIPQTLIEKVKYELDRLESYKNNFTFSGEQTPPADLFAIKVSEIAKEYFTVFLNTILSTYPQFLDGGGAPSSAWRSVKKIKWYQKIQDYIQTIPENHYIVEPFLLQILSKQVISIEDFLNLKLDVALEYQTQAEQASEITPKVKAEAYPKHTSTMKLIPWRRGEDYLQDFWKMLIDSGYIGPEVSYHFLSLHFKFINEQLITQEAYFIKKIVWNSSLTNLLMLIEKLNDYGIISVSPFKKRFGSSINAGISNLINEHFCTQKLSVITIDYIRQVRHRKKDPNSRVDTEFITTVLKNIRLID